jgi:hypothetical protein
VAHFPREAGLLFLTHFPLWKNRPMRLLLIAIMTFSLGAGATFAQTPPSGAGSPSQGNPASGRADVTTSSSAATFDATGTLPQRLTPNRAQSRQNVHDSAVADCMQMWDSGTHMTKQAWLHTCKRIETRLDNLNVESLMPKTKTTSEKIPNRQEKQLR